MTKSKRAAIAAATGLVAFVAMQAIGWKAVLVCLAIAVFGLVIIGAELAREIRSFHHGEKSRSAGGAESEG